MVLKLYTYYNSINGKRVAITLHEKNVPFELHNVDVFTGEHKVSTFLEKQPFGQVPYLDDDGFILYESRAISLYIATKYADQGNQGLIPTEPKANALFHQAVYSEVTNIEDPAYKAVVEKLFKKPVPGLVPDEEFFKKLITGLDGKLDVYEKILSKQKYLIGNEVTLADLYHIPYLSLLPAAGCHSVDSRPNVARWFKDITSRKSWQAVKDGIKSTSTY
ncbi:glutathione S-transferase [Crepidotus variabilis]|uniref:glutathione transferase n=1 Tax=Crepidotus variabilis TaxID=179855 RepID=A0A9P6JS75_9AGAR|nr:glutathione S-transferase [Crepidotus variabilis]